LEHLEDRVCPSVNYDFDLIARSGADSLTGITAAPSINDKGEVAFVGSTTDTASAVFAADGTSVTPLTPLRSSWVFNGPVQINNNDQVAAINSFDPDGNGQLFLRQVQIWDADHPGSSNDLIPTGLSPWQGSDGNQVSLDDQGDVAFLVPQDSTLHLATGPSQDTEIVDVGGLSPQVDPIAASGGRIVVSGGGFPARSAVALYQADGSSVAIVPSSLGFTNVGIAAGTSDDGTMVAFYGELSQAGATNLNTTPGPGIFVV